MDISVLYPKPAAVVLLKPWQYAQHMPRGSRARTISLSNDHVRVERYVYASGYYFYAIEIDCTAAAVIDGKGFIDRYRTEKNKEILEDVISGVRNMMEAPNEDDI